MSVVFVSVFEEIKIYFLTIIYGLLMIFKILAKWLWDPKAFILLKPRDKPPTCLVDTALGQHKYVKLKVSLRICTKIAYVILQLEKLSFFHLLSLVKTEG